MAGEAPGHAQAAGGHGGGTAGSHRGGALRAFARAFFHALGAPVVEAEPDAWYVELSPEQKAVLEPPVLPWWAMPPTPPETVRWCIAFHPDAAARHPEARLLTPGSHLFHRMRDACRDRGLVAHGTLWRPGSPGYRPVLWLHVRVTRRGDGIEPTLEPWRCDLARGSLAPAPPPPWERLRPGSPPDGVPVEPVRMTPPELWRRLLSAVAARAEHDGDRWTEAALARAAAEEEEICRYYAAVAASAASRAEHAPHELEEERDRRLAEVRGRHFPRLMVEPVAATLVYLPSDDR